MTRPTHDVCEHAHYLLCRGFPLNPLREGPNVLARVRRARVLW